MHYLWNIWDAALWVVMPLTLVSTVMLSLRGLVRVPENGILKVICHEGWCILIVTVIPWHISAFARGEMSPLPWRVYTDIASIGGMGEGIMAMLIVCIVDLWLLWTPAQIYAHRTHPSDRDKVKFVRIINGLAGLLLFTPGNPFFRLLQLI